MGLPLPPAESVYNPCISLVTEGLDDEVVKVDEVKCPICYPPLFHGGQSDVCLYGV